MSQRAIIDSAVQKIRRTLLEILGSSQKVSEKDTKRATNCPFLKE